MDDEESGKFKVILVHPCAKHAVKLPKDISYNNLLEYVKKRWTPQKGKEMLTSGCFTKMEQCRWTLWMMMTSNTSYMMFAVTKT